MKRKLIVLAVAAAALWLFLRRYTVIEGRLPLPSDAGTALRWLMTVLG